MEYLNKAQHVKLSYGQTMYTPAISKTPIHIITGFLGSGKTTFIKQILSVDSNQRTLILINEIGHIGLDDLLMRPITNNTYLLPSGCMCCTVLSDVKQSLLDVQSERERGVIDFDYIVIETTGLANPASILTTLQNDPHLKGKFVLHGMTCVIDGELAFNHAPKNHTTSPKDNHPSFEMNAPEWLPQIVASHQLVLSKQDRIDDKQKKAVINYIATLTDSPWVSSADFVNMSVLFAKRLNTIPKKQFFMPSDQREHDSVQTCVLSFETAVDWAVFGLWLNLLLNQYGEQILRIKGMLYLKNVEKPIVLHGVQHCLYPPEHLDHPLWDDKISRLVMITRGVDTAQIQHSAQVFMASLGR